MQQSSGWRHKHRCLGWPAKSPRTIGQRSTIENAVSIIYCSCLLLLAISASHRTSWLTGSGLFQFSITPPYITIITAAPWWILMKYRIINYTAVANSRAGGAEITLPPLAVRGRTKWQADRPNLQINQIDKKTQNSIRINLIYRYTVWLNLHNNKVAYASKNQL